MQGVVVESRDGPVGVGVWKAQGNCTYLPVVAPRARIMRRKPTARVYIDLHGTEHRGAEAADRAKIDRGLRRSGRASTHTAADDSTDAERSQNQVDAVLVETFLPKFLSGSYREAGVTRLFDWQRQSIVDVSHSPPAQVW